MSVFTKARKWVKSKTGPAVTGQGPVWQWNLDYPSVAHGSKVEAGGLVVQGWVLFATEPVQRPEVLVRWNESFDVVHGFTRPRPDVIANWCDAPVDSHPQLTCGFRFTVPPSLQRFELWLRLGAQQWLLKTVEPPQQEESSQPLLKVLRGRGGWLFLDNDTNNSVDQFCGRLALTPKGITQWQAYLEGLARLAEQRYVSTAMLIAPAKEAVLGDLYHPMAPGRPGPVDQVLALPGAELVAYPNDELQAMGDESFHQTDTHWTHKGALAGVRVLAGKLGIQERGISACFEKDVYRRITKGGDLGNKLNPPQTCEVDILHSFNFLKHRVYDNGLPNFGRVIVTRYDAALVDATCLVFGSSSSYSMFNYLARLFRHLVFVHSAGNVDEDVVAACKPDYLVTQTNARFVVVVPTVGYSLKRDIEDKANRVAEDQSEQVAKRRIVPGEDTLSHLGLLPWCQAADAALQKRFDKQGVKL